MGVACQLVQLVLTYPLYVSVHTDRSPCCGFVPSFIRYRSRPHRWCDGTRWGRGYPKLIRIAWGCVSFILIRPVPPMYQVEGVAVDPLPRDSIYCMWWVGCVPEPVSPTGAADVPGGGGRPRFPLRNSIYSICAVCVLSVRCRRPVVGMSRSDVRVVLYIIFLGYLPPTADRRPVR